MWKSLAFYIIIAVLVLTFIGCEIKKQPYDFVNPFIGTSGDHGQLFPGAVLPFGMAKLSPDTYPSGLKGKAHSGYNYLDGRIMGFSHVRLGGEGCEGAGGNILVLPMIGDSEFMPEKYASTYDKQSELAQPGYYRVALVGNNIECELTVTEHAGLHRYTFPKSQEAHILIDLGRAFTEVRDGQLSVKAPDQVEGYVTAGHLCHSPLNYTIYFSAQFSKPFNSFSVWQDSVLSPSAKEMKGRQIGVILDYATHDREAVLLKVGLSIVDVEHARKVRDAEIPDWDFNAIRTRAKGKWEEVLRRIMVSGAEEYKQLFYTALYHAYQMPVKLAKPGESYRGTDGQVHQAQERSYYSSFSIWDTFRTKYPLLTLTEPARLQDIVCSLIKVYEQGATDWPFLTVRREHMLSIIADAYTKGLRDFDAEKAYEGMYRDAFELKAEMESDAAVTKASHRNGGSQAMHLKYDSLGYYPMRPDRTLENSYDNWCVAQMATMLGKEDDYQKFMRRAGFYRNVWDGSIGFFRARADDGTWLPFPNPRVIDETYVYEATMWQWRWFVMHEVPGLIELVGGAEKFISQLEQFFAEDLYNHANEQDLHASFLFNMAGAPWLTQEWVHKILAEPMAQLYGGHQFYKEPYHGRIYKTTPDGYLPEMDDDCGTMSAWFVLAAMGMYPVCPGEPSYQLTAPLFDKVELQLDENLYPGKRFVIEAKNLSEKNIYIQSAMLNGAPYAKAGITHADIVRGGKLVFQMGPEPNKRWGMSDKN